MIRHGSKPDSQYSRRLMAGSRWARQPMVAAACARLSAVAAPWGAGVFRGGSLSARRLPAQCPGQGRVNVRLVEQPVLVVRRRSADGQAFVFAEGQRIGDAPLLRAPPQRLPCRGLGDVAHPGQQVLKNDGAVHHVVPGRVRVLQQTVWALGIIALGVPVSVIAAELWAGYKSNKRLDQIEMEMYGEIRTR